MKCIRLERSLSLAATVVLVCACAAMPARAEEWSKSYNLTGQPELRVETSDANIHVTTWDQKTLEAKVTTTRYKIGEGGIQINEHQAGDTIDLEVRFPHHGITFGNALNHRVDIEIRMPREGRVDLRTGDGKIELANIKGDMQLHTGDGSVEIEGVDGKLHASSGDGHIRASGRFDDLELKTSDGRVEARASAGSSVSTSWRLESGDGTITLEVPENLAADVDLHTGDGHIDLDMPVTTEGKIRENEVHGKLNGGGNLLVIHTGDGSIRLRKA